MRGNPKDQLTDLGLIRADLQGYVGPHYNSHHLHTHRHSNSTHHSSNLVNPLTVSYLVHLAQTWRMGQLEQKPSWAMASLRVRKSEQTPAQCLVAVEMGLVVAACSFIEAPAMALQLVEAFFDFTMIYIGLPFFSNRDLTMACFSAATIWVAKTFAE